MTSRNIEIAERIMGIFGIILLVIFVLWIASYVPEYVFQYPLCSNAIQDALAAAGMLVTLLLTAANHYHNDQIIKKP